MRLYELTESYRNIFELVGEESMDLEALEAALQSVEGEIESKAENIVKMMKGIQAEAEQIKAEEQRLMARRKAMENNAEGLKKYMEMQLKIAGIDKVKTPLFTVALQNNNASVEIIDESLIPEEYIEVVVTRVVQKKEILEALKGGKEVQGAMLKNSKSLRIR